MQDWQDLRETLNKEVGRQATSNKSLLWVGSNVATFVAIIALTVAIFSSSNGIALSRDLHSMQKELSEFKAETKYSIKEMESSALEAVRAYNNDRKTKSRETMSR